MRNVRITLGIIAVGVGLVGILGASAQTVPVGTAVEASVTPVPGGVEVNADRLEYEAERKLMIGIGNVVVHHGEDVLHADCVTVQTETKDAYATGNVRFLHEGKLWEGEELSYNFDTGQGDFGTSDFFMDPFYVRSEDSRRISADELVLDHAVITTCDGDNPPFRIRTTSARLLGDTEIRAKNVFVFLGPIPIFFMPFAKYDVERKTNIDFLPGYSSRWGAYALMAYNYRISPVFYGSTHYDYRTRRGSAVGQDFKWSSSNIYAGKIQTYYASDDEPYRDADEGEEEAGLVDTERYRIRLEHKTWYTDRLTLDISAHYLSDPDILEDFFREEYREKAEPENRAVLTYRADNFTAALKLEARLNDFYETVDRLPEATLDFQQQQIGNSEFYYRSENAISSLERQFTDSSGDPSYDAFRVDSSHMISYPMKRFGFLNVIPRAGYRGTYYSKTRVATRGTNSVTVTETNVVGGVTNTITSLTNETFTIIREGSADVRNILEFGVKTSFKAFKVIRPATLGKDGGLRHVIEPYANYTFIPEPNLVPGDLFQFDDVDELDETHKVRLGMRNKWQNKRATRIRDLVDIDLYSDYRLNPDEDENDLGPLNVDCELRPVDWVKVDFDGTYDWDLSEVTEFNTQIGLVAPDDTSLGLEYRYELDGRDQIAAEWALFPNMTWSLGGYVRYDLLGAHLEEQSHYIQRQGSCLGWALGYEGRGSDWDFMLRLWLAAFPESGIGAQGHY